MIELYSNIEIVGKIIEASTKEELNSKTYGYCRLMYKEAKTKLKFINVFSDRKDVFLEFDLAKGDVIKVKGILDHKDSTETRPATYSVLASHVELLEKNRKFDY